MKLFELATPKYLYHVTFSKKVPSILKKGLQQFQTSNWVQAGTGERYNEEAGVFAFEHPEDAVKWGVRMEWEFKTPDIAIVRINPSEVWEQDPSQDINLQFGKGRSLRSRQNIPAEHVIDVFQMKDLGKPGTLGIGQKEWFDQVTDKLTT